MHETWYYQHAGKEVGLFEREVLEKLKAAGIIDDFTPVRNSGASSWQPLREIDADRNASAEAADSNESQSEGVHILDSAERNSVRQ